MQRIMLQSLCFTVNVLGLSLITYLILTVGWPTAPRDAVVLACVLVGQSAAIIYALIKIPLNIDTRRK